MKRDPIGTTRVGQIILGTGGCALGLGLSAGLAFRPAVFEPMLRVALFGLDFFIRGHFRYDPSQRPFFIGTLAAWGLLWLALFAYAFARQPARDRALDEHLARRVLPDESRGAPLTPRDDPPG